MANVGYIRVSSKSQNIDVQQDKLAFCDKVFIDKRSGLDEYRPNFKACMEYIREGDKLIITKLDRLARSTLHLSQIVSSLQKKNVELVVLDQNIDTSTSTGKLLFNVLAAIAEFETEIRKERQAEGVEKAKKRGVKWGPKHKLSDEQVSELCKLKESGISSHALAKQFGISHKSVYRYLERVKKTAQTNN